MPRPKGSAKPVGSGRQSGTPNKSTQLLKDAILRAAELAGDDLKDTKGTTGLEKYLVDIAEKEKPVFCGMLGKVLPMQIAGTGEDDDGINITIRFK